MENINNDTNNNKFQFDTKVYDTQDIDFKIPCKIVIISKSNSGKSTIVNNIIYNLINKNPGVFNNIYVLSETAWDNDLNDYSYINTKFRKRYTEENMAKIFDYYKELKNKNKPQHCILVLDDIKITRSKILEEMMCRCRHYFITIILSAQFATHALSPVVRNNFSYLLIREMNSMTLFKICKEILVLPGIDEKEIFNFIINNINNFQFIMYDNNSNVDKKDRMKIIKSVILNLQVVNNKNKNKNKK